MNPRLHHAPSEPVVAASTSDIPHESAHLHVTGEAAYVDDLPELARSAHAALGLSAQAHARVIRLNLEAVLACPEVIAVLTAADIPGHNDCGPIIADDPILADGVVHYIGQPIFAVIAESRDAARRAARLADVEYQPLPALLDPVAAAAAGELVVPAMQCVRGDAPAAFNNADHRLQGDWSVGGQEQFYLEGQIAYVAPAEDGCLQVWCSTQHPSEMQHLIAQALGLTASQVRVEMRRMGGGFGGKESQSALFACVAAVAAKRLGRPVKLRPDRDDDMMITGKRHDFRYRFSAGYDSDGLLRGVQLEMIARAGFSADLSGPVATRALCHVDNAYCLEHLDVRALCARTHTQSNTAFRGFGGPQGAIFIEYLLDTIARRLGLDPLTVRKRNFYAIGERDRTHYGQKVEDNVLAPLVEQLEQSSQYQLRRAQIAASNQRSALLKRGIALTPVKFGISFNVAHFNQAGALVHVYTDGSVLVSHGGTEMGQGLNTKVAQIVAHTLGIPVSRVRASAADTSKVPNTSATAASTGTDLNGKAAEDAALQIRARLAKWLAERTGCNPEAVRFADDRVCAGALERSFPELIREAYQARVQLWSDGFYATPGLHWDSTTLSGKPFHYFAYGAAVSEVQIDTLTGEWRLLRADLLHDAGNSINPAIDRGQIEGGFIQGMGWLTSEELCWNEQGRLMTHAPSTYKIPAVHDCPVEFHTELFHNPNRADTVMRSKAVGEPPLLLAFSVFFALRDAIASLGPPLCAPPLRAPATPEAILDAIDAVRAGVSA